MTQDLLPQIPSSLPLLIVDNLLYHLTHRHSIKRRSSWVLLFIVVPTLVWYSISSSTSTSPTTTVTSKDGSTSSVRLEDVPSIEELQHYERIYELIENSFKREPFSSSTSIKDYYPHHHKPPPPPPLLLPISVILINPDDPIKARRNRKFLEFQIKWLNKLVASTSTGSEENILQEVIVWNDDISINLTRQDLNLTSQSPLPLKIFNPPARFDSLSPLYACALLTSRKTNHCYIVNELNWLNGFFRTMYHHYSENCSGGLDGKGENAKLFGIQRHEQGGGAGEGWWWWKRIVINEKLKLQTAPLRFYSSSSRDDDTLPPPPAPQLSFYFIPKPLSNRFLSQLNYLSKLDSDKPLIGSQRERSLSLPNSKELLKFGGDLFFTVWLNSIPEIWTVVVDDGSDAQAAVARVGTGGGMLSLTHREGNEVRAVEKQKQKLENARRLKQLQEEEDEIILRGIKILSIALSHKREEEVSPFHHSHSPSSLSLSHARVPCWNDECIFLTSIPSFPYKVLPSSSASSSLVVVDPLKIPPALDQLSNYNKRDTTSLDNDEDEYEEDLLPFLAVDSNVSTCYKPIHHHELHIGDYYGLEFVPKLIPGGGGGSGSNSGSSRRGGRDVRKVELIGSESLGRIVSWDKQDDVVENGEEGWVVLTERKNGGGGWEPRQLVKDSTSIKLDTTTTTKIGKGKRKGSAKPRIMIPLFKTLFELIPITTPTTFTDDPSRGTYELKESGVVEIGKIKLVRIGGRRTRRGFKKEEGEEQEEEEPFVLCGWNLDGWEV